MKEKEWPDAKYSPWEIVAIERLAAQIELPVFMVAPVFDKIVGALREVFIEGRKEPGEIRISPDRGFGRNGIMCSPRIGGVTMLDEYSAVDPEYWKREYRQACESGLSYITDGRTVPDDVIHRAKAAAMNLRIYSERRGL